MPGRIEDYAVIGNCETMALVGRDGSIDWLSVPRFDSPACFAALLGGPEHGRWRIAAQADDAIVSRHYRGHTMVLETTIETATGTVLVIDFMARRPGVSDLVRLVRGVSGSVAMKCELVARFDYGSIVPWVSRHDDGRLLLTAGAERLVLDTPIALEGENMRTVGSFDVIAGQEVGFTLNWSRSYHAIPPSLTPGDALAEVEAFWLDWVSGCKQDRPWSDAVRRSLITLKGLAHWETGGIVASATTSLPELIGGTRNWDYRCCWLRDASFTLFALINAGYLGEAQAWLDWLMRAIAGSPDDLQIMYGIGGERRLTEYEIPWLPGYENSAPVRIGNAAAGQLQLDVYGEVLGLLYIARRAGLAADGKCWALEKALVSHLETIWRQPDDGIWEIRGERRHFTHSKVMAWVAFDRAIRSIEEFGLEGPVERWREVRDTIHREVCERGFDRSLGAFIQAYDTPVMDASLLMLPLVGFLPADDERVRGTVAAIERQLMHDGLVARYDTSASNDGLPPGEGTFLACSFWLVGNYALDHREDEARQLFERLVSLANDVGLLSEEYDPTAQRQLGNFPQAFSHLALINAATQLQANAKGAFEGAGAMTPGSGAAVGTKTP